MNTIWGSIATTALSMTFAISTAWARPSLNAMCYKEDKTGSTVQGDNQDRLFPLASVSKIVTSFWAVDTLGPDYRFITTLYITPVTNNLVDLHISGGWDPYFGHDMMDFLISELNRNGVRQIRTLSFDENFSVFWMVREKPTLSFNPTPDSIETLLKQKMRLDKKEYQQTLTVATRVGVKMEPSPSLTYQQVTFVPSNQFQRTNDTHAMILKSAPLSRYLKEMNRNSNNNVADHIFNFLGGADKFKTFMNTRLHMDSSDVSFVNGSGDSVVVTDGNGKEKVYNEASCDSLITVIMALRDDLHKTGKDLPDVLAVSGLDPNSTLGSRYDGSTTADAMVAKTGTVDPAVTLAGMISTTQGDVYFGVLYHTTGPADWTSARNDIRDRVTTLMLQFGGRSKINDYSTTSAFLPFDVESSLLVATSNKSVFHLQ